MPLPSICGAAPPAVTCPRRIEVPVVKFSFRPTEGAFYELFSRAAQNLVRGTELLNELGLPGADVQSVSERLRRSIASLMCSLPSSSSKFAIS